MKDKGKNFFWRWLCVRWTGLGIFKRGCLFLLAVRQSARGPSLFELRPKLLGLVWWFSKYCPSIFSFFSSLFLPSALRTTTSVYS
jgi:hypothetical protein